jgi:hypothetical protein
MRILIACEYSGTVRDAFAARGHYAMSCDLLPTETEGMHYQGDVFDVIDQDWDMAIMHPPCTHLAVSGAAHFAAKIADGRQQQALDFVQKLMDCKIPKWCLENPISIISSKIRKPDQIIQPWMFGHPESKATCLWLNGLPKLKETKNVKELFNSLPKKEQQRIHYLSPSADRWKIRSKTFQGIADAMAEQWS